MNPDSHMVVVLVGHACMLACIPWYHVAHLTPFPRSLVSDVRKIMYFFSLCFWCTCVYQSTSIFCSLSTHLSDFHLSALKNVCATPHKCLRYILHTIIKWKICLIVSLYNEAVALEIELSQDFLLLVMWWDGIPSCWRKSRFVWEYECILAPFNLNCTWKKTMSKKPV